MDQQCFDVKEDSGCFISKMADVPGEDDENFNSESRIREFEAKVHKDVDASSKIIAHNEVESLQKSGPNSEPCLCKKDINFKSRETGSIHGSIIGCHDQFLKSCDLESEMPVSGHDIELNIPISDYEEEHSERGGQDRIWDHRGNEQYSLAKELIRDNPDTQASAAGQKYASSCPADPQLQHHDDDDDDDDLSNDLPARRRHTANYLPAAGESRCHGRQETERARRPNNDMIKQLCDQKRSIPREIVMLDDGIASCIPNETRSRIDETVQEEEYKRGGTGKADEAVDKTDDELEKDSMGSKSSDSLPRPGTAKRETLSSRRGQGRGKGRGHSFKSGKRVSFRLRHER